MIDHFARLGLPRRFALEDIELEHKYLARSRAVHPDYHARGSSADQAASLELSAALNEAYNTLKDPFTRAEYLLALDGGPSASEHRQIPQAFLAEMLELRERVEEARAGGTVDNPHVAALSAEFTARYDALLDEVAGRFTEYENLADDDPMRQEIRLQIRSLLNAAKYIRGLLRDLHAD
ncbi:MAG TPA: Fe-S protein assembly co-chaperone HscB [Gemmataceae bacterium]|nr:Fe-S protein assembly co-chaperone HscB [Gemmataceae bacterium]